MAVAIVRQAMSSNTVSMCPSSEKGRAVEEAEMASLELMSRTKMKHKTMNHKSNGHFALVVSISAKHHN